MICNANYNFLVSPYTPNSIDDAIETWPYSSHLSNTSYHVGWEEEYWKTRRQTWE